MPSTVAILIPEPGSDLPWRPSLATLKAALATAEIAVETAAWTAEVPAGCDAVLPLLAWGYQDDVPRWFARIEALAAGHRLINPAAVLRWNTRKTYLFDLERAGVAIVPTLAFGRFTAGDLAAAMAAFGTDVLVVKPVVSASSKGIQVVRRGADIAAARNDVLVQPFLDSITTEGELSLVYIEGRFSHAVKKSARAGEYRVQVQFGGTSTPHAPEAEAVTLADAALAQSPEPTLYARVDMVRRADGRWAIIELELIEPDLFLELAPDLGQGFAQALKSRLGA